MSSIFLFYCHCRVIPHLLLKCLPNTCNLVIPIRMHTQTLSKEEQASNNSITIDSCVVTWSFDNNRLLFGFPSFLLPINFDLTFTVMVTKFI